jgi:hypothetical protein
MTLAAAALSIAAWKAREVPRPPRLMLMTDGFSPFCMTQSMALTMPTVEPEPWSVKTFTACSIDFFATPDCVPPTVPAQCVP